MSGIEQSVVTLDEALATILAFTRVHGVLIQHDRERLLAAHNALLQALRDKEAKESSFRQEIYEAINRAETAEALLAEKEAECERLSKLLDQCSYACSQVKKFAVRPHHYHGQEYWVIPPSVIGMAEDAFSASKGQYKFVDWFARNQETTRRAETAESRLTKLIEAARPFYEFADLLAAETEGFADLDRLNLRPEESDVVLGDLTFGSFRRILSAIDAVLGEGR